MEAYLLKSPTTQWQAVLTQLLLLSFRRFCVERLSKETNSDSLWDNSLELITSYAPKHFKPYFDSWLQPEKIAQIRDLQELDGILRELVTQIDTAVIENDDEKQDNLAELLDTELHSLIKDWLGTRYQQLLLFPSDEEQEGDDTRMKFVVLSLSIYEKRQGLKRTLRAKGRRSITPIRNQMKKTRRQKQDGEISVSFSSNAHGRRTRRNSETEDNGSEREKREGGEVCNNEAEGKAQQDAQNDAEQEGNHEHPKPQVYAESVQAVSDADKQLLSKNEETEEAA
jgi:hypothetical protein